MSSIRTVAFGDAKFKWDTGKLRDVGFDHAVIKWWNKSYIKPRFKVKSQEEVRHKAFDIMHDAVANNDVKTMKDLTCLIMAMRMTLVDANTVDEDGYLSLSFMVPSNQYYEKVTFYNIPWHINHHCKQLFQFCFVQLKPKYLDYEVSISYTTGEWKDKKCSMGIDFYPMKDKRRH